MPATELITAADLRANFAIDVGVVDAQLTRSIKAGSRRLKAWVGTDVYADALSVTPTDTERKEDLQFAECHLAMHYAILGLNSALRQEGIVRTEKVEGDAVLTYLSPDETAKVRQQYLDAAEEIARAHMLEDGTPDAPFEFSDL